MTTNARNTLIAVIVVAVVLIGGFYIFRNTTSAPEVSLPGNEPGPSGTATATEETAGAAATVVYTAEGFSPGTITIKKGETVRFTNEAQTDTWPASAIHPTHGVYPEKSAADCLGSSFDACRALKTGESWDFTFNHVGTWRYHNHLRANQTGTIVVEE